MKNLEKNKIILGVGAVILCLICIILYLSVFKTYTVRFDSRMGTSIKTQEVKKGHTAKKPQDPIMEGYEFLGWYYDGKEFDFNTKITENMTIVGQWQEKK